jgi:hypothetical protein
MTQWVFAKVVGVEEYQIRDLELLQCHNNDVKLLVTQYLATAPRPRQVRAVSDRPKNVYLTVKLMTWAKITGQPTSGLEAVKGLREAYERAKREEGLASIPLIQLEVENALTLATRGAYRKMRHGS